MKTSLSATRVTTCITATRPEPITSETKYRKPNRVRRAAKTELMLLLDFRFLNFVLFCRELQHLRHFFCEHPVLHLHPEAVFELRPALPLPSGPQRTQQDQPGRRLRVSGTRLDAITVRKTRC